MVLFWVNETSGRLKREIAAARKKALFARGVFDRAFESPDDALPALLSALKLLNRVFDELGSDAGSEYRHHLELESTKITALHEEYLSGSAAAFTRRDLDQAVRTVHRLCRALDIYRIEKIAGKTERVFSRMRIGFTIGIFALLFVTIGVGLYMGLRHPGYDEGLTGNYYQNERFGGFRYQTIDHQIDFKWGRAEPVKGMPKDHFSIKWQGCIRIDNADGMYLIGAADDDIRVYVDGEAVVDSWGTRKYKPVQSKTKISKGMHPIEVQYREIGGQSFVFLGWSADGSTSQAVPAKNLIPRNLVLGGAGSNYACPAMPPLTAPGKQSP